MVPPRLVQLWLYLDDAHSLRMLLHRLWFIAAFSPNELFASLLVPAFFTFVVSFCGVVVPYFALPHFWQSWMYWLTPFHYLLEGFLSVATHRQPVRCLEIEEANFSPPPGSTCQQYAGAYAQKAGGYTRDAGNGLCAYCQYSSGDRFVSTSFDRLLATFIYLAAKLN